MNGLRIDKWLWFARFFKSRTLAQKQCEGGHVSINGSKIARASVEVREGDVVAFEQGDFRREVRVLALGERRGPAAEAQALYEAVGEPVRIRLPRAQSFAVRDEGAGRPTKKDRRAIIRFTDRGE